MTDQGQRIRRLLAFTHMVGIASLIAVSASSCSKTSSSTPPATVQGQAIKGPFAGGATVNASQINSPFGFATGSVDGAGNYSVVTTWTGPTTIAVSGNFRDDFTDQITSQPVATPLLSALNLPTTATTSTPFAGQVNLATNIAAQALLDYQAGKPSLQISSIHVNYFNQLVAQQILGLATSATDITQVVLTNTTDPNATQVLAFQIAVASLTGSAGTSSAVAQLANNILNGMTLGSTPTNGLSAPFTTAQLQGALNAVVAGGNITVNGLTTVLGAAPLALSTVLSYLGTGQTVAQMQSQVVAANVYTALRGFALHGNALTVGSASGTVAITNDRGQATMTGSTSRSNLSLGFTLADYSNGTGTGPGSATTYPTTFAFGLVPAQGSSDLRTLIGTISPVQVATNGAGGLTLSIPANAIFTISGLNTSGTFVSPTNTSVPANFMVAGTPTGTGTPLTINLNALLTQVQAVFGTQVQVLDLAGTYNVGIGFSIPIGIEKSGGGALAPSQLLPQGTAASWTVGYTFIA
ncbi:MAG: hypothetical protein KGO52_09030, partial [Nitrospirota bacterium]|nr:hypothetical protein [Nitrospirota bacterium]